ncbi:MAG: hypothetical protein IPM48_02905 [Saprospiraceae bacterium]|nr:hypothetical protein [Saprospiraceae bacterium]
MILEQCKRLSKDRVQRLEKGIDLLEDWILKLLEQGFEVLRKDAHRMEDMATRAVDYGMPAIARRLRLLPEKITEEKDWVSYLNTELGQMLFLIRSIKKPNTHLHPEDILSFLGVPIKKQEIVDHTEGIEDEWLYFGTVFDREEKIRIYRHWFYGIHHHKFALCIDFEVNRFVKIREYKRGWMYCGPVHFYPSALPLRVVQIPQTVQAIPTVINFNKQSIQAYQDSYAKAFAANPFLRQTPACLSGIHLIEIDDHCFLSDPDGTAMVCRTNEDLNRKMRAYCLDPETLLLGEFSEKQFNPLSVFSQGYIEKI